MIMMIVLRMKNLMMTISQVNRISTTISNIKSRNYNDLIEHPLKGVNQSSENALQLLENTVTKIIQGIQMKTTILLSGK